MKKRIWIALMLIAILLGLSQMALAEPPDHQTQKDLPNAMAGVYYVTRVKATGPEPITFNLPSNPYGDYMMPPGLSLTKDGLISGTPTKEGTYSFVVEAVNYYGQATQVYRIKVTAFDETQLNQGGENTDIIGDGHDSIVGITNGVQGGRVAMIEDDIFFIDSKGYLNQSAAPYQKAVKVYKAPYYAWLDSLDENLYYYHRYFDNTIGRQGENVYRIMRDPMSLGKRKELTRLIYRQIQDLAVTDRVVVYIRGEEQGILQRLPINGGRASVLRCNVDAKEVKAKHVFPYNGVAYLQGTDQRLYAMWLDGEVGRPLTEKKVSSYTVYRGMEGDGLCYAAPKGDLMVSALSGGEATPLGALRGDCLNADEDFIYFSNLADGHKPYKVDPKSPDSPVKLGDIAVDQIYVFDEAIVVKARGKEVFYLIDKFDDEAPQKLN